MQILKGITWNHTRGYAPLAVTAKVYNDFHPDVEIEWAIRSLWSFGEEGLDELARRYDLLLVDHPFMGSRVTTTPGTSGPCPSMQQRRGRRRGWICSKNTG